MEGRRVRKQPKSNLAGKGSGAGHLQGEGDYASARRYDSAVRRFVRRADIEGAARAAAPRNKREAEEMAEAEAAGRQGEPHPAQWFLGDINAIRRRARAQLESGAVTDNYQGDVRHAVELLNQAVATEIVCVLRYKYHSIVAPGISSDAVKVEFTQHAKDEEEHLDMLC